MKALIAALILAATQAEAHQVQFVGDVTSNAGVIVQALAGQGDNIEGLVVTKAADGSLDIFREDGVSALHCIQNATGNYCQMIWEHDRPFDSTYLAYPIGTTMDGYSGDDTSNAKIIVTILNNDAQMMGATKAKAFSTTGTRFERKDADSSIVCTYKTDELETPAECSLKAPIPLVPTGLAAAPAK